MGTLQRLAADKTGDLSFDQQMAAIRTMAETILDLRALDLPLMSPPPLPLQSMLHLTTDTNDLYTYQFVLRQFVERTETILDMHEAIKTRTGRKPF